jgi:hypothetical protein
VFLFSGFGDYNNDGQPMQPPPPAGKAMKNLNISLQTYMYIFVSPRADLKIINS